MSTLLDVLLTEQLVTIFRDAMRKRVNLNATLVPDPAREVDLLGDGGTAVRISTRADGSLLVSPRRIVREVGAMVSDVAAFTELVGYDWISPDLSEKVRLKDDHYDRLYLHLQGSEQVVLDGLGPAVYPLMTFLGKVLELRSQKVLLRGLDDSVSDVVDRCLRASVEGPFFTDEELQELFAQDRPSLSILAGMWSRMNLAAPDLHRTVTGVMEMLLERRSRFPEAWDEWMGIPPSRVEGALEVFRRVVGGELGGPRHGA
jgi:hypothetical protein